MKDNIRDLSNVYGYARLFITLKQDGIVETKSLTEKMYGWYCSNISAYNESNNENLIPLERQIFHYKLHTAHVQPYATQIQTIKALHLLEWNQSGQPRFVRAQEELSYLCSLYKSIFQNRFGYEATNTATSYALCENTLDPEYEPPNELNPEALVRKYKKGPKLVYICAPLRGDVEKNIEFARLKAKEVFVDGKIPICPHLMFPPIADPGNPTEDKAAMEMCLKLMDHCNEVHVYGGEWTEGMWQEIHHAERMKIPVLTDQETVPRSKSIKQRNKER